MGRAPCCEKLGLKKGRWIEEEDSILRNYILLHGEGSWRSLPKNAGLQRCGKSCRLRWINYLRSDLKRGNITEEEEELIVKLHSTLGNRWSTIAGHLPGRTDNEIKNYWNSHLSRRIYSFMKTTTINSSPPLTDLASSRVLAPKRRTTNKKRIQILENPNNENGCSNGSAPMPPTPTFEERESAMMSPFEERENIQRDVDNMSFCEIIGDEIVDENENNNAKVIMEENETNNNWEWGWDLQLEGQDMWGEEDKMFTSWLLESDCGGEAECGNDRLGDSIEIEKQGTSIVLGS